MYLKCLLRQIYPNSCYIHNSPRFLIASILGFAHCEAIYGGEPNIALLLWIYGITNRLRRYCGSLEMLNSLLFGMMLTGFAGFMAWLTYDAIGM